MSLRIYNSLSRSLETFTPITPGKVGMYVCGITVYDYCHIGHARAMMAFDVIYRWLREVGFDVKFVRNHTDVDDKIITRAAEVGEPALELSERFIAALDEDLGRMGLETPTVAPKVSDHIPEIIELVSALVERGHAYAAPAPDAVAGTSDVFFAVESFAEYGKLSGKKLEHLRAGERVVVDPRKRHPGDFALWKAARPGEVRWDSPWGVGRPGWHIECSAMGRTHLGDGFDIHGGGIDLIFPHHENEIAQSEGGTGHRPFARYWLHNGHLNIDGEKMSKSLGNFVRIRDILDQVPADALRLLYVEAHYRSPLPYSGARLAEALAGMDRIYTAKAQLEAIAARPVSASAEQLARDLGPDAQALFDAASGFADRFAAAMNEDFNTARVVGLLYELVRASNRYVTHKRWLKRSAALAQLALEAFELSSRILGIGGLESADWFAQVRQRRLAVIGKTEGEIEARIADRTAARAARDWATADQVRVELAALGVELMDGASGTTWRMRVE